MKDPTNWFLAILIVPVLLGIGILGFTVYRSVLSSSVATQCRELGYTSGFIDADGTCYCVKEEIRRLDSLKEEK